MSGAAILMMLLAMLVIWGGLAVAIINLTRSPDAPTRDELNRDL